MIRIAINGFGRIGRTFLRQVISKPGFDIVAINDLTDTTTLAHLLKYDSIHRRFPLAVTAGAHQLHVGQMDIPVFAEKDPGLLPWERLGVDIVIESSGRFTDPEQAALHLKSGAKRVIISAPAKGNARTVVIGVNENLITSDDKVISNASCTTNNAAPMIQLLDEAFGIEAAYVTTVHAYTGDQNLHDAPHKDLRRARAAAQSIIPTTTGAAKAISDVFPHLKGKIGGAGIRVPVINGSMTDITCTVSRKATLEDVNHLFKNASIRELKGILEYTEDPIVSTDIIGNTHSCIFDSQLTSVLNHGHMVKVVGWYDNECGYSARLVELCHLLQSR